MPFCRRHLLIAAAAMLALAACSTAGEEKRQVAAAAAEPLTFDLGVIDIVDETAGPVPDPALAGEFSVSQHQAMRDWAARRLQTVTGQPGLLRVRITEAASARAPLERTYGVKGWFTKDQVEKVVVAFAAQVEARRNDGSLISSATARAEAYRTFAEGTKPADRRRSLNQLQAETLAAFDREMEARIRAEMSGLLR